MNNLNYLRIVMNEIDHLFRIRNDFNTAEVNLSIEKWEKIEAALLIVLNIFEPQLLKNLPDDEKEKIKERIDELFKSGELSSAQAIEIFFNLVPEKGRKDIVSWILGDDPYNHGLQETIKNVFKEETKEYLTTLYSRKRKNPE